METSPLTAAKYDIKHWYLSLIAGIFFIAVGIWVFRTPVTSYISLAILFSILFLVNGIFEIVYYSANRKAIPNWGWGLASGIIDLLLGLILVSSPGLTLVILPYFVGFMLLFRSVMAIAVSFEVQAMGTGSWGVLLLLGILGIIFSFIILWNPILGGLTVVIWTALALITVGIFRIFLAFRLRNLNKVLKG